MAECAKKVLMYIWKGSRRLENRLVVPGSFLDVTTSQAIVAKIEEEIIHLKELCTDMSQKDVWVLKYAIKEIWTVFELKAQVLLTE